jgi:ribose transport system substrate-binding protein
MKRLSRSARVSAVVMLGALISTSVGVSPAFGATRLHQATYGTQLRSSVTNNHQLGFLLGVANNPFYLTEECWANIAAKQQGYTVNFQAPSAFDVTQEDQVTLAMAARRPAGEIIDPVFGSEQAPTIDQVIKDGIPVATVEEPVSAPGQVINITAEHQILGKMGADMLAKAIGYKGEVFIGDYQKGVESTDARREGFLAELKKYPNIKYVGEVFTGSDETLAAQDFTSVMERNPNIKGIFGTNLYSIQGAITALQQDGKLHDVKIVSTDVLPNEIQWLKSGEVYGLLAQKPGVIGATAVDTLIAYLNGKRKASNTTYLLNNPFVAVTQANMNEPSIKQYFYTSGSCAGILPSTVRAIQSELPPA